MNPQVVLRTLKTPATLMLLLAFVAWVGQWSLKAATDPVPPAPPEPCVVQQVGEELTTDRVFVRVFNGTEVSGLAKRLAANLRADGFNVYKTTNTPEPDREESVVIGYAEDSPEVILVRQAFKKIPFEADGRIDHSVDVIIGAKEPVLRSKPAFSAPLPDGTACIPQITVVNTNA
ncbi:MAG: LytR C-terminal domain-containing protein [Propioniciclava sp.]